MKRDETWDDYIARLREPKQEEPMQDDYRYEYVEREMIKGFIYGGVFFVIFMAQIVFWLVYGG